MSCFNTCTKTKKAGRVLKTENTKIPEKVGFWGTRSSETSWCWLEERKRTEVSPLCHTKRGSLERCSDGRTWRFAWLPWRFVWKLVYVKWRESDIDSSDEGCELSWMDDNEASVNVRYDSKQYSTDKNSEVDPWYPAVGSIVIVIEDNQTSNCVL